MHTQHIFQFPEAVDIHGKAKQPYGRIKFYRKYSVHKSNVALATQLEKECINNIAAMNEIQLFSNFGVVTYNYSQLQFRGITTNNMQGCRLLWKQDRAVKCVDACTCSVHGATHILRHQTQSTMNALNQTCNQLQNS